MAKAFSRKRHQQSVLTLWYQAKLRRNPFLFFGLPFISIIIFGSFALSSVTTLRYERHDLKVKVMEEEDLLKLDKDRRRPDIREEYYVSAEIVQRLTVAAVGEGLE
jgi:cytochrome c oxidase assembly protein subunit 16